MALSHRQKLALIPLLIYWPTLFILTHMPVPLLVRQAHVSDKGLHFLAFLILVFLLWSVVGSGSKINWPKAAVWWVLLVTVVYGVVDEWLQSFITGRSPSIYDFLANLSGVATALVLFTFFRFRQVSLIVLASLILTATTVTKINLAQLIPITYTIFHLFAYACFALLWGRFLKYKRSLSTVPNLKWLSIVLVLPLALLAAAKLLSILLEKSIRPIDITAAIVGVVIAVAVSYFTALRSKN